MTAKELKKSILLMAIQGKLVKQNPLEEPASKLLERIIAHKNELVKTKRIKQDKPLTAIKEDEVPFEIPDSWIWCRLGIVSINKDGNRVPISQTERESRSKIYDYYGASGVIDKIDGYTHDGDFLLIGEDGANLRMKSTPIAFIAKGKFWVNNHAHILEFVDESTLKYMEYCLNIIDINPFISGGFQPKLSQGSLNIMPIPLPPLAEQQRIVDKIEELLPLVEQYGTVESELRKLNTKFPEQLRKSVLQYAVQGKLVPQNPNDEPASLLLERIKAEKKQLIKEKKIKQDKLLPEIKEDEIPFEIPDSWVWVRLGNIVSILGDGIHGTPNYDLNGEYYFVNGNNLSNGEIIFKASTKRINYEEYLKHRKELNLRTILVSINGTLGNIAFYNNEKIILGKSACYFNLLEPLNMNYIKLLINSSYFEKYAISSATQTTIQNVSLKSMRELLIPLPPLSEQKLIVEKVEEVLSYCDKLK